MISFVIPTLNEESVIEKLLKCLESYSGEKEIIVSDGGSTDKTREIASRYTKNVLCHDEKTRQNIAGGRNAGAKIARGDYIVFMDADDYIKDPDLFFERLEDFFSKNKEYIALTVKLKVLPEMETFGDKLGFGYVNFQNFLVNNIFSSGGAPGEFQMIKRWAFEKIGGFDEKITVAEDYELCRRLRKLGKIYYDGSSIVYHTGRRAHKIGWPKLLSIWLVNGISVLIFKKSYHNEWKVIR